MGEREQREWRVPVRVVAEVDALVVARSKREAREKARRHEFDGWPDARDDPMPRVELREGRVEDTRS